MARTGPIPRERATVVVDGVAPHPGVRDGMFTVAEVGASLAKVADGPRYRALPAHISL